MGFGGRPVQQSRWQGPPDTGLPSSAVARDGTVQCCCSQLSIDSVGHQAMAPLETSQYRSCCRAELAVGKANGQTTAVAHKCPLHSRDASLGTLDGSGGFGTINVPVSRPSRVSRAVTLFAKISSKYARRFGIIDRTFCSTPSGKRPGWLRTAHANNDDSAMSSP